MLAIYRQIHSTFWQDSKVADDMTPEDKYFYLYILTNPHTNQLGCYEISIKQIINELGYDSNEQSVQKVSALLDKFDKKFKCIKYSFDTKELLILNWYKYNWSTSPKVKNCILKEKNNVKNSDFLHYIDTVCIPYIYHIDTISVECRYPMHTISQQEQEQEQKQEQEEKQQQEQQSVDFANAIKFFNENAQVKITPFTAEEVSALISTYGSDLFIEACKISVKNKARTLNYIEHILINWHEEGIKTINDLDIKPKKETVEERAARLNDEMQKKEGEQVWT